MKGCEPGEVGEAHSAQKKWREFPSSERSRNPEGWQAGLQTSDIDAGAGSASLGHMQDLGT